MPDFTTYSDTDVARAMRAVMREIQLANGEEVVSAWDDRPYHEQEASAARAGLRRRHTADPRDEHQAWMRLRLSQGWKRGPVKDSDAKITPDLVDYGELPFRQTVKDELQVAIMAIMSGQPYGTSYLPGNLTGNLRGFLTFARSLAMTGDYRDDDGLALGLVTATAVNNSWSLRRRLKAAWQVIFPPLTKAR